MHKIGVRVDINRGTNNMHQLLVLLMQESLLLFLLAIALIIVFIGQHLTFTGIKYRVDEITDGTTE